MPKKTRDEFDDRQLVLKLLARAKTRESGLVHMESCSVLLGLGLQNFQAISEPTFLPFGRLTLLYGPNSSGKSSVSRALTLWTSFARESAVRPERSKLLGRWANYQRHDSSRQPGRYVSCTDDTVLWIVVGPMGDVMHRGLPEEDDGEPQIAFRMLAAKEPYAIRWIVNGTDSREFSVWIGEDSPEPFVKFTRETASRWVLKLNRAHPQIKQLDEWRREYGQTKLPRESLFHSDDEPWLVIEGVAWRTEDPLREAKLVNSRLRERLTEIAQSHLLIGFIEEALGEAGRACSARVVLPIRPVPTAAESTFTCLPPEDVRGEAHSFWTPPTEGVWQRIAESGQPTRWDAIRDEENLVAYINRVMVQEDLLNLGYQIEVVDYDEDRCLRHVQLRDKRGSVIQLEDVGTGVSQLIPVLEALHFGNAVIHQPELHLHPRLQSALGDLLIEHMHRIGFANLIVESHSEHLLLRVLRRIRESGREGRGGRTQIAPEDVVILFFDRQDGVGTRVQHLRVNEKGEFLDRWPAGFFTERDEDLNAFLV